MHIKNFRIIKHPHQPIPPPPILLLLCRHCRGRLFLMLNRRRQGLSHAIDIKSFILLLLMWNITTFLQTFCFINGGKGKLHNKRNRNTQENCFFFHKKKMLVPKLCIGWCREWYKIVCYKVACTNMFTFSDAILSFNMSIMHLNQ